MNKGNSKFRMLVYHREIENFESKFVFGGMFLKQRPIKRAVVEDKDEPVQS